MKLNTISTGSGEQSVEALRTAAVSELLANLPVANLLEFYSIAGNADSPRLVDGDMTTVGANRTIGTDYTAKGNTPDFGAVVLKIYGDKVKTDIAHIRRGKDIKDQRLLDLLNFSRSLGRFLMNAIINDAISATAFSGLKEQCTDLSRVTHYVGANGGSLPAGKSDANVLLQHGFLETLDAAMEDIVGGPQALIMNGSTKARLKSIARNSIEVMNVQDVYGANQQVETYNGIPIINAGYKNDNSTLVIPNNETLGTSSDCTSIYLVRFGEEQNITFATNVGLDVKDLHLVGTEYITMVEMDLDLVILNSKAVKRLDGIRLSA